MKNTMIEEESPEIYKLWESDQPETIEVKYTGDIIFGLHPRIFTFTKTKIQLGFKYEWVDMPQEFKKMLLPSQYAIESKAPLSDFELLEEVKDIYEAVAVENENQKNSH